MEERREQRREQHEERRELRAEQWGDRRQQHGRHGYGDNSEFEDGRNRYGGGLGTTASQGFGNQSAYAPGTESGGGYNPSYAGYDPR